MLSLPTRLSVKLTNTGSSLLVSLTQNSLSYSHDNISGLSDPAEDKGKLSISCVTVAGARESLGRGEAGAELAGTGEFVTGPETASSVDTWHYDHLKL